MSDQSWHRISGITNHLLPVSSLHLVNTAATPSSFFYTTNNSLLTLEQRQHYETHGFIVIKGLLSKVKCEVYRKYFVDLCNDPSKAVPTMTVMKDVALIKKIKEGDKTVASLGEGAITKVQDFQDDPILFSYCQLPEIIKYASAIIGPNLRSVHTMLINKPPDVGSLSSRHPLHQDLIYFPFRPENLIVCAWTAMQTISRKNGGLCVLPGSHKTHLRPHGYPQWEGGVNKAYHGIMDLTNAEAEAAVYLDMEIGDTVFFHPLLIHGSGANLSSPPEYRKSISCHFASSNCIYIDVQGTLHMDLAREIEEMAFKKTGMHVPFCDVWRMKSRLILGNEGTLI